MTDQEKLSEMVKRKNRIRYQIRKIEKKSDDELKAKDVKDLQKYNKQVVKLKDQISKLREKIKRDQVTSAYTTVVRRSNLTDIDKRTLLARNWFNTDWLDGHEYLTKMDVVQNWQKMHPLGTKKECEIDTGMSHHTIDKWWIS